MVLPLGTLLRHLVSCYLHLAVNICYTRYNRVLTARRIAPFELKELPGIQRLFRIYLRWSPQTVIDLAQRDVVPRYELTHVAAILYLNMFQPFDVRDAANTLLLYDVGKEFLDYS